MSVPFVTSRGLGYAVGGRSLVHGVDLALRGGEVTIVVGPNGAGKSTLLKLLTGQLRASSGAVAYGGDPPASIPARLLACRRAVMSQAVGMAFPFAVHEVVALSVADVGRALSRRAALDLAAECLAAADMLQHADRDMQSLSGGEQQRVHFARVLAQLRAGASVAPRQALFLDEPTASLDLRHQLGVLDTARRLAGEGIAVLAILHDLNLAAAYADQLVAMHASRIVARGDPRHVLTTDLMRAVFGVDLRVGEVPRGGAPFVLFGGMTPALEARPADSAG